MIYNSDINLKNKGGIYKISTDIDNRIYIGSTNNFYKRYNDHKRKLIKKNHANKYLQSFFDKYGKNSLSFEILTICKNSCLLYSEKYFIAILKPNFNIKKIIERKYFEDEVEYDLNKNKRIVINFIDTMINEITDN